jgi:iron complex outermembrane receptor protein
MFNRFALALAATASLLPMAAVAQTTDTSEEEIVITGNRRGEELLREVPQSVTAITAETLERTQAHSLSDYVGRIPGMSVAGGRLGNERITLRGLNAGGVASTIATYVDETPFGSSSALANGGVLALDLDPSDVQRVEVLRGPQGTLYGSSALGGVMRFITVDPDTGDFSLRLRGELESTEDGEMSHGARGLINIPLGDQAGLRLSGWLRSDGGFIDDSARGVEDVNSGETVGFRAKFLLHATDNLAIRLTAMTQTIENDADNSVGYFPVPLTPVDGELDQSRSFSENGEVKYDILNGTVDWDLGWASLSSSSSYTELNQSRTDDSTIAFGLASYLVNTMEQDKFTQELRLASPDSDRFEWLLGFFYTDENADLLQQIYLNTPPGGPFSGLDLTLGSTYEEIALYANGTYYFSPQFDINVGVRFSQNEQTVLQGGTAAPANDESSEDEIVTYSISPRWRMSDDTMLYARIATGYRPGGPNVLSAFGTAVPPTFDPDTATNYEVGIKSDVIDGLLRIDAALFRIDWDDIQVLVSDGTVSGNGNGGTATSEGLEWAATLTPADGLTFLWSGAYTDARLTSDTDPSGGPVVVGGVDGDRLPGVAEWTSSIDGEYEFAAFGGHEAYVGGTWRYVGERMTGFSLDLDADFGVTQIELPSYNVLDLRAGVDFGTFAVELFAKNATDERTILDFGGYGTTPPSTPTINGSASVLRPRTVGISLSAEF